LYENRVQEHLRDLYGQAYIESPWIIFADASRAGRWCQPDGVLIDVRRGRVVVVEAKYQHTARAWFQLFQLYLPVVRQLFPSPSWECVGIEVCKWFDPATPTPEPAIKREFPIDAIANKFCVHIWKP
jgi:hypothetical protein